MKKYLILLILCLLLSSCHVVRFFTWNFADIKDYKKFPSREIKNGAVSFLFQQGDSTGKKIKLPREVTAGKKKLSFDKFLEKHKTVAFLIIRNDSVYYEKYFNHYSKESIVPSFSMAKSFVSVLMGIAIQEGFVKSVQEPVTNYFPELKNKEGFEKITIEHLLNMRSGIRYVEKYFNPFGDVAKFYYGVNLKKYISKLTLKSSPDKEFDYISVNTQLLGMIVERATGKTLSQYLQEKIWQPLQMEYPASWSIDSKKNHTEKAFCCLNARARDFAKFGRLYLKRGNWNGKQIVPEQWVASSTDITPFSKNYNYSYQWWHTVNYRVKTDTTHIKPYERIIKGKNTDLLMSPGSSDFYADGFLGQFIYVYPKKNLIIVRLGKNIGGIWWPGFMKQIAEQI